MSDTDSRLSMKGGQQMSEYRAQVTSTEDPKKMLRVQVRVPGWWSGVPDEDLPWAEYRLNDARAGGGSFMPAEKGDWVWVDFPNGDTRYPRITGWCHFAPGGKPNAPHDAWQGPGAISHRLDPGAKEPSPEAPEYHGSLSIEKHGAVIEINPGGEILVTQRDTGTALRVTRQGEVTIHGEKSVHISGKQNLEVNFGGDINITAGGDLKMLATNIYEN